jgi:hypothetical protein
MRSAGTAVALVAYSRARVPVLALFHPLNMGLVGQSAPALVSLGALAKLWWEGELFGAQQAALVAWFIAALVIQLASHSPWIWIAGYVGQVALAIVAVLKNQIDDIY